MPGFLAKSYSRKKEDGVVLTRYGNRQRAEGRGQKAEGRRQKAEGRGQKVIANCSLLIAKGNTEFCRKTLTIKRLQLVRMRVQSLWKNQICRDEWRLNKVGGQCPPYEFSQSSVLNPPSSILNPPSSVLNRDSTFIRTIQTTVSGSGQHNLFQLWRAGSASPVCPPSALSCLPDGRTNGAIFISYC